MRRVRLIFITFLFVITLMSSIEVSAYDTIAKNLKINFGEGWHVKETNKNGKTQMIAISPDEKYQAIISSYGDKRTHEIKDFNAYSQIEIENYMEKYFSFAYNDTNVIKIYEPELSKYNSIIFIKQDVVREYEEKTVCERQLFTIKEGKGIIVSLHAYGQEFNNDIEGVFNSIMFVKQDVYLSLKKFFLIMLGSIFVIAVAFIVMLNRHLNQN